MAENNWAIVIGINKYDFLPPDDHLKYAVNDAVKMRQFLCEQAKFPQENVLLCCDRTPEVSPQQRPSRNGLRHLLKNEIQRAKGANNFWFFYAGHGIVHEHQDFLLPCDGNPRDLEQTAIPISFVTDCLRDCGAAHVVLVMDMCRNRTRGTDEGSRGDIGEVMGEQTQQIAKAQGIVTLFSCSRGERSYEIGDLEQGAFTYALLEGLKQGTTPRALEHYLTQRLPALNLQHGKTIQMPMVIPEPGWKYDRPLLLSCATPADIQQLAVQARDAELEEQDYEKAQALWRQVIEADRSTQSDRAKALKAIERISNSIRREEAERQFELERQEQLKQEAAAAKQRQAAEQQRQRKYQENLQRYEQEFRKAIEAGYPIDSFVRDGLNQFQQSLELSDEDVARIEAPLVAPKEAVYQQRLAAEQRRKEEAEQRRKGEAERQLELERQQKLEQQRQEQLKQEAAAKQRQAAEQERQQREAEELKRQQAEAERLRQEEFERQRILDQQGSQSSPTNRPNQPPASVVLARRQFLKWAIPAGVGAVGVTVASQFLGHQSPQSSTSPPLQPATSPKLPQPSPQPATSPEPSPSTSSPSPSATTVDYSKLEGFMKAGQWKEADQETSTLMLKAANREKEGYLDFSEIDNFPCEVLSKIDRLWVKYSNGHFGFSVQKKIWQESGSPTWAGEDWDSFCVKVGWQDAAGWYVRYSQLKYDLQKSPKGELPFKFGSGGGPEFGVLGPVRVATCRL